MDPALFRVDFGLLTEILITIIVLAFFVERALILTHGKPSPFGECHRQRRFRRHDLPPEIVPPAEGSSRSRFR